MGAVEPQIQYTKTADGISIAYWTMGQGPPLVLFPPWGYSHIQLELQNPEQRAWFKRLAQSRMVVRFDPRGQGLSQKRLKEFPPAAVIADLNAVVDDLNLGEFDLWGTGGAAGGAFRYAARNPARVKHLVTFCATRTQFPGGEAVMSLADKDWRVYTEALAQALLGFSEPALGHAWAQFIRRSISEDDFRMLRASLVPDFDAPGILSQIKCPTLVMHRLSWRPMDVEDVRELASSIPGARLALFEGSVPLPFGRAENEIFEAMDEFLGRPERQAATAVPGTAIILFADIADSTALTERLGDAAFRERARELDTALRQAITSNGGTATEGKLLGDGVLATFGAAREAIACAMACHEAGSHAGLPLHIGVHAGDVIREEGNVYGGAVNIAARVAGEAAEGETLVSGTVRDLARTSAGVSFEDRGERELKGIGEPVRVWAVVEQT